MITEITSDAKEFGKTTVPLLSAYATKLESIATEARCLRDRFDQGEKSDKQYLRSLMKANQQKLTRLRPVVARVAKTTSQWIQNGDIDDATRLSLEVGLADVEASLQYADDVVQAAWPR